MQNRFGLKDFILLVLVAAVGIIGILALFQDDRRWGETRKLDTKLTQIERQLARMEDTLSRGVAVRSGGASPDADPATRDTSWARPGVEIAWWPEPELFSDPTQFEDFAPGGVFTEVFEGQPPTITPYRYADVYGRRVVDIVVGSLGRHHPETLEPIGRLAEAWQYDPNGLWFRAKIHDQARYSDGEPVTADDFVFTFDDIVFNPEIESDRFRSTLTNVEAVTAVSDKVVEFAFKEPVFSNFEAAITFRVIPRHVYGELTPTQINESTGLLMGSGPFKLETFDIDDQWKPGETLRLVRNEAYWGRRPALDGLNFNVIRDSLARLTAYTNGDGDMIRPIPKQFDALTDDDEFLGKHDMHRWFNMRGGYSFVAWQCGPRNGKELTPFHDPRVRLAMTHMFDQERIRRDIGKGLLRDANGPFSRSTNQANPDIESWPYDEAEAKRLLAEAGWTDTDGDDILENAAGDEFRWEIKFGQGSEGTLQMVTYLKDQCAKLGIICELAPIEWAILADTLNKRDFDAITFAWSASVPESDPRQIWHSSQIDGQGDNFIQWRNPDADRLIIGGRTTIDEDARMKQWHQLHSVMHEDQPYTFISETPWLRFVNKRIGNFTPYKTGFEYGELYVRAPRSGTADE